MKRVRLMALLATAALLLRCSTGPDPIAGGSGAGNPGGVTALAIIADTSYVPQAVSKSAARSAEGNILPLADDGALVMNTASARFVVYRIHFILANIDVCDTLIDSFDGLACDSVGVALDGPFAFDAVSGSADSLLDSLRLPVAQYRGIKLAVGCAEGGGSTTCSPVQLSGTFDYDGAARDFAITVPFNTVLLQKYTGTPALLDLNDTTLFEVRLSPRDWLNGVDLAAALDSQALELDSAGNLGLDGVTAAGAAKTIVHTIRDNIAASFQTAKFEMKRKM